MSQRGMLASGPQAWAARAFKHAADLKRRGFVPASYAALAARALPELAERHRTGLDGAAVSVMLWVPEWVEAVYAVHAHPVLGGLPRVAELVRDLAADPGLRNEFLSAQLLAGPGSVAVAVLLRGLAEALPPEPAPAR